MRIAIFSDLFLPSINGVTVHIVNLVRTLADQGHTIALFVPKPSCEIDTKSIPDSVTLHYLSSTSALVYPDLQITSPFSIASLSKVHEFKPDVIHFHSPGTVGCNALIAAKVHNIPVVGTFHAYLMEPEYLRIIGLHKVNLDKSKTIVKLGWMYSNMFYNQADIVISPSETTKQDLILNGLERPIEVISSGVDAIAATLPASITFSLPQKYLLYVGRLSNEKSVDIVIKSFSRFAKKQTDIDLVIVGDGPAAPALKRLSKELNMQNRIHFLGMITNDKLLKSNILRDAIAFVSASKSETLAISILEALSFHLPVIGVKARALPEVIQDNGILCDPDDVDQIATAMQTICEKRQTFQVNLEQIHKTLEKHSVIEMVDKIEKVYKKVISSSDNSKHNSPFDLPFKFTQKMRDYITSYQEK